VPDADPIVVQPFWSGDSRYLLFSSGGALKKADDSGGAAQTVCALSGVLTGGFTDGDRVVFAMEPGGLFTVPLGGGTAVSLVALEGRYSLQSGALLPDGDHFVFALAHPAEDRRGIYVASLTGRDQPKRLLPDLSSVTYVPSASDSPGSLLFTRGGAVMMQPFNPGRLELAGEPHRIVEGVKGFSASASGAIVYRAAGPGRRLVWMDRQGNAVGTVGAPDQYLEIALSPDGSRAAAVRYEASGPPSTSVFDLARESSKRLQRLVAIKPVWSADGKQIVVASRDPSGGAMSSALLRMSSDGTGSTDRLLGGAGFKAPRDVSPDGKWLLYVQAGSPTKEDLFLLSLLPGEHTPEPFLSTDYIESDGMFSPDGRFVAYVSNENGGFEVYVRSFPGPGGGKWRVSNGGGYQPRWRSNGKELFFFTADGRLMSTDVTLGATLQAGVPRTLFRAPVFSGGATVSNHYWDVSPDGQRFLVNTTTANDASSMLTVVLNWQSGLPAAGRN
jgi:Tol biopolymer transport system component